MEMIPTEVLYMVHQGANTVLSVAVISTRVLLVMR